MYGLYQKAMLINQERARNDPNRLKKIEADHEAKIRAREFQKEEDRRNELDPLRDFKSRYNNQPTVPNITINMNGGIR